MTRSTILTSDLLEVVTSTYHDSIIGADVYRMPQTVLAGTNRSGSDKIARWHIVRQIEVCTNSGSQYATLMCGQESMEMGREIEAVVIGEPGTDAPMCKRCQKSAQFWAL